MRKKRLLGSLALIGVVSMSLLGCGKEKEDDVIKKDVTVDSLFSDSNSVYKDLKSASMNLKVDISGNLKMSEDTSMSLGLKTDLDIDSELDKGSFCNGSLSFNALGITQDNDIKVYTETDGENQVSYTYNSDDETWVKENNAIDLEDKTGLGSDTLSELSNADFSGMYEKLKVSNEDAKYGNEDAYHVYGDVSFNDIKEIVNKLNYSSDDVDGLDDIVVGTDFYFSKKDKRLIGVSLDFTKADFSELVTSLSSLFSSDSDEDKDIEISFEKFSVNIGIKDINDYTYELPEEVTNNLAVDDEDFSFSDLDEDSWDYTFNDSDDLDATDFEE